MIVFALERRNRNAVTVARALNPTCTDEILYWGKKNANKTPFLCENDIFLGLKTLMLDEI